MEAKLKWYEEQLRLLQHKRFGVSSEKTLPGQLELFNEVENESNLELPEPTLESIRYQRRRKTRGQREAMLENLPVETVEYRLSDEEQVCSCCGGT
ncbi:IS66 family transposase [Anoxybacteroides amylolyticum]|uniref:IS66 family transposase n=1 Tax=Anoxybacteroides amylolyticum TaxID=294699 RepID=UPI000830EE31